MTLATNEMGDDLKLHLVGDNHIAELVVWGFAGAAIWKLPETAP